MNRASRRRQAKKGRRAGLRRGGDAGQLLRRALHLVQNGEPAQAFDEALAALRISGDDGTAARAAELAAHAALGLASADESATAFAKLAQLRPDDADILNDYGGVLSIAGRFAEAETVYRRAAELVPDDAQALTNLGQALLGQKKHASAESMFRQAVGKNPNLAAAHSGLGIALEAGERAAEAVEPFRRAYRLKPDSKVYRDNLEAILKRCGIGIDEREKMYRAALINDPSDFDAAMQLACVMRDTERLGPAREIIDGWIARESGLETAQRGRLREILSELQFLDDDFAAAWPNYHWRLKWRPRWGGEAVQPEWRGEDLRGKSIFVYAEQGVGDQVMFMALMPALLATGARVTLECDPRLVPLFRRSFPDVRCLAVENPPLAETLDPDIDFHVAMGSLACWLWPDFNARPRAPYIRPDTGETARLRQAYRAGRDVRLIGVSWASPLGRHGPVKSLALSDLAPVFGLPDTLFVDLQYGDTLEERQTLERETGVRLLHDETVDQWADLDAFAAQVAAMDAVVSVSNSTAHLAGALGVPTWVLLSSAPQWKWGGNGADSVWYGGVRLLRRRHGAPPGNQIRRAVSSLSEA